VHNIFNIVLDFVFPPNPEELILRTISPLKLVEIASKPNPTEYSFIEAVLSYKDPLVKELVWQIKYKKNKVALELAGHILFETLSRKSGKFLLIPIPISNKRRRERGYNQCELIINEILKLDRDKQFSTDFSLIRRMKHIEKQTFMKRNERLKNTENIFEVTSNALDKNTKIIIIDDVSTTGSTLNEARNALLEAGFTEVYCQVIAH
jgi:competence protein ComFC